MALEISNILDLPTNISFLLYEARRVAKNAYNAYSHFYVGASLETTDRQIFLGTFMENASYGLTVCAEVCAIMAANTHGKLSKIRRMAVVGGSDLDSAGPIVMPCGRCRQIICEASQLSGNDTEIYCANGNLTAIIVTTAKELLPLPFAPQNGG